MDLGYHSVTKWVEVLRSDDILAVLSGFEPHNTPGVGTFYDFFDRLWLEDRKTRIERRFKLRSPIKKPKKKLKAGSKQPVKHPGVVGKLCKRFMDGRVPFPLRAERLIQEIFARCFVDVSVHMGLIPDPLNLVLSGDGSSLRTGSSPHGVKVCDCKRRFSDPEASWGFVSFGVLSLLLILILRARAILRICLRSTLMSMVFLFAPKVMLCVFVVLKKGAVV
ncbi:hypothetical protein [Thermoanaerobacterium sp. DL9XJH110]|uniref:hypothetical protein n=1 Tax=Thermoanaerobacterium sp. DL9XJH110 TaxID=3386643 RepID=UPI003BB660F3